MELQRLWLILSARRVVVLSCIFASLCAAGAYSFLWPKRYVASASVLISPPMNATQQSPSATTQVDIVSSPRVLQRALRFLTEGAEELTQANDEDRLKVLARGLSASLGRDSNVLQLIYYARSPRSAAAGANAVARAYLEVSDELRKEPIRQGLVAAHDRLKILQAKDDEAQGRLASFKRGSGLIMSDERVDAEQAMLNGLIRRSTEMSGQRLDRDFMAQREIRESLSLQALRANLQQTRGRLKDLAERIGPNHPEFISARSQVDEAQAALDVEVRRMATSVTASSEGPRGAVIDALERQKNVVRGLTVDRDRLGLLQREADDSRRAMQVIREKVAHLELEEARTGEAATLLALADMPRDVFSPVPSKVLPLAAVLGLFAGVFGVVALEQLSPRIRRNADLQQFSGIEVLARIPDTGRMVASVAPPRPAALLLNGTEEGTLAVSARPIGKLLVEAGAITLDDAEIVVLKQKGGGEPFGKTAVSMGLITPNDLKHALALQFGRPRITALSAAPSPALVVDQDPDHPVAEAIRELRSQLLLRPTSRRTPAIAIVSAEAGDGRTFVATNLAIAFSQIGSRVLLIDGDLRHPALHLLFGVANGQGLSGYLAGRDPRPTVEQVDAKGRLALMPGGPKAPNPQELLSGQNFELLLAQMSPSYDVIIVDTPALANGSDAQLISVRAASAVLVARLNHGSIELNRRIIGRLVKSGVDVVGAVVNEAA